MLVDNRIVKYQTASENTDKTTQLIILYEQIIKFLNKAQQAILDENIEERFKNIEKAINIINNLQLSLNEEEGGEVAATLNNFYHDMIVRLHCVNLKQQSAHKVEFLIRQFKAVKDVWHEIRQKLLNNQENPANQLSNITIKI